MVESEAVGREAGVAVLAGVVVAEVDVAPVEGDLAGGGLGDVGGEGYDGG